MKLWSLQRRRILRLVVWLGVSVASWQGTLRAQALPAGPPGPPGPNEFDLTATVGERSNSNAFFAADSASPEGDYISTLALALTARRHSPRTDWSLNYRPILSHYLEFSDLDSFSQAFDGGAEYKLSERSKLLLRETFALSRDPVIVATPQTGNSPILTNARQRWHDLSEVSLRLGISRSVAWLAGLQYFTNRFEDPVATDSEGYLGRTGVEAVLGREDTLSGTYSFERLSFSPPDPVFDPAQPSQVVTQSSDSTAHELAADWLHGAGKRWQTEMLLGSSLVNQSVRDLTQAGPPMGRDQSQRLFIGRAALRRSFRRVDLEAGYQRRLTTDTGADAVTVGDSVYLSVSGTIGRQFTYGLGLDYGTRKSVGGATTPVDLTFEGATLRSGYSLSDRCSLTALANLREQKNTGPSSANQRVDYYFLGLTFKIF